jgi:hypothetical protein
MIPALRIIVRQWLVVASLRTSAAASAGSVVVHFGSFGCHTPFDVQKSPTDA